MFGKGFKPSTDLTTPVTNLQQSINKSIEPKIANIETAKNIENQSEIGGRIVADTALSFIPYGIANKALEGVKVISAIKNPIIRKALVGTIANTLISTPQVIARGIEQKKLILDVVKDVESAIKITKTFLK